MSQQSNESVPSVNVFKRFGLIWTPTFLKQVLYPEQDKAVGRTWAFWFLWNSLAALAVTVVLWFVFAQSWVNWVEKEWWSTVPEFEAEVKDGVFSTNLPQPYVIFDEVGEALVVIDTEGKTYNEASLKKYEGGLVVTAEKMIGKEQTGEQRIFTFADFEEDVTFNKADAEKGWYMVKPRIMAFAGIIVFFGLWFWLCVIRLLSAVWWALVFWAVGAMCRIPEWSFGKSYLSVMNFYIMALIFETGLLLIGVGVVPFSTLLVFSLVFGVNFYAFKQAAPKE